MRTQALPVSHRVVPQRLRCAGGRGGESLREGRGAGDGHARALPEQRDAVRGVADEDDAVLGPCLEPDSADGVEVHVVAGPYAVEYVGYTPPHAPELVGEQLLLKTHIGSFDLRDFRMPEEEP